MIQKHGIKGIYRGYVPGILCVSTRNGASMIAMQGTNKLINKSGLRSK